MDISPRALVDLILLGPIGDRRQIQASPVLGDVWLRYAAAPSARIDLLISPDKEYPPGPIAASLEEKLKSKKSNIAYLQGLIVASLKFSELFEHVLPLTAWWENLQKYLADSSNQERLEHHCSTISESIRSSSAWGGINVRVFKDRVIKAENAAMDRIILLSLILLWAEKSDRKGDLPQKLAGLENGELLEELRSLETKQAAPTRGAGRIWQITPNRSALLALDRSIQAVKGDAAKSVFTVNCKDIAWAIIDSGIDRDHPSFLSESGESRVVKTLDFSRIRQIVEVSKPNTSKTEPETKKLLEEMGKTPSDREVSQAQEAIKNLADDVRNDRPIHWEEVEKVIELKEPVKPVGGHGTHVAGIVGGRRHTTISPSEGMCPDIKLYDLRVFSDDLESTEFAIIAALQYIRYLNERSGHMVVHGANLSVSIPHDVRNYACGRTPICNECERLVDNGVVVVAAAGNLGYHSFETNAGSYDGYAAFSITDPGNADGVITVGATHRFWPHTYGISYFSSRGPTGDGRLKPDLVAPGERISSCLPDKDWGELDGTSMAAPHVSGAAAMLMARYSELIGQPRRIKKILCQTATDLGRDRTFQGHGMLDVLRAFQAL